MVQLELPLITPCIFHMDSLVNDMMIHGLSVQLMSPQHGPLCAQVTCLTGHSHDA